jgi:RNA polymerase sigma-70 factor (ECF subfamily)
VRLTIEHGQNGARVRESRNPDAVLPVLIRRAQAGDAQAFERVAESYRDRMFRWALVRTGDEDDAEDATQEALVRLHRGLRTFRGAARFETWLYSVTRSAAADVLRRRRRGKQVKERLAMLAAVTPDSESDDVLDRLETYRIVGLVASFLRDLPARQREAFDLVDLQGIAPGQAAARLGLNPATLRTHLFRARRGLRARLLDGPGEEQGSR